MAKLRSVTVPTAVAPVLRKLGNLRTPRQNALVEALSGDERLLSLTELREAVAIVLTTFDEQEVSELVGSLMALASLAGSHNFEIEGLASDLATSSNLELTEAASKRLAVALAKILAAPAVAGLARAFDVGQEHERVVHTQRIISDVRPVFADPSAQPLGVVITHMLRIEAVVDGRVVASTFALDSNDLEQLRELVDRAQTKESSLSSLMTKADLPVFVISTDGEE